MKIFIVGIGNIGYALLNGILSCNAMESSSIIAIDPDSEKTNRLTDEPRVSTKASIDESIASASVIILAVKPQELVRIAKLITPFIDKECLIISALAGVAVDVIRRHLNGHRAIVRAMPNIAATIGQSPTVICFSEDLSKIQQQLTKELLATVGEVYVAKEDKLDAVTGLGGSGPAYIYMVIEAMSDGGVKMGLSRVLAQKIATQTVLGAAKLVKETQTHPAILRDQVSTPGGTTISAIHELESHGLRSMLISAVVTATEKSTELGKVIEKQLDSTI